MAKCIAPTGFWVISQIHRPTFFGHCPDLTHPPSLREGILGAGGLGCRGAGVGAMHSGGVLMVLPGFNGRMHRPYGVLGYWPNGSPPRGFGLMAKCIAPTVVGISFG